MKKNTRGYGFTLVELLVAIFILGILATMTVFVVKAITDKTSGITVTMEGPKADTSALIPAPWVGVNQETWSMLYDTAVSANLDFTLWESEGNAGQLLYSVSFTKIRIGSELDLLPCVPTHDENWLDFESRVQSSGFTVAINDKPVLDQEGHPGVHTTMATVLLTADSRELAAQQATNLFHWLDSNPLSCA